MSPERVVDEPTRGLWSPLLARGGQVALPAVLLRHQARLGLSHGELVYVLHILAAREGGEAPALAVADVAAAAGVHVTRARSWKASLVAKGYLATRTGLGADGAKRADRHDLSGLLNCLESLVVEEETRSQLAALRRDLPPPRFQGREPAVPQLGTPRRLLPRASENARPSPRENTRRSPESRLRPVPDQVRRDSRAE